MKHLVLVDDSSDQIELMQLAIHALRPPLPVAAFTSGEGVLEALQNGAVEPALVLLDVNMPGLDGPATVSRIRGLAQGRWLPVVMLSTSDRPEDVQRCLEAGASSYLLKPRAHQTWTDVLSVIFGYWCGADLGTRL
jgi:CheY-like chemotaxis protein